MRDPFRGRSVMSLV